MYVCLAVTCHLHFWQNDQDLLRATVVTWGWNGYRHYSQHRNLTLENKILPPLLQGFEPGTFQSRVRHSNHWAIPVPYAFSYQKRWISELGDYIYITKSKHFALRPQYWGGLLGTGRDGGERVKAWPHTPTQKTGEAVHHCQNHQNVKAVCPRHCTATSVPRNCCFNCCVEQSHKDNVHVAAVE